MLKHLAIVTALLGSLELQANKANAATPNPTVENLAYTAYLYAYDAYYYANYAASLRKNARENLDAYYAAEYAYQGYVNYVQTGSDEGYFAAAAEYSFLAIFDDYSHLGNQGSYTYQSYIYSFYAWYYLDAAFTLSVE